MENIITRFKACDVDNVVGVVCLIIGTAVVAMAAFGIL